MGSDELNVASILLHGSLVTLSKVVGTRERGETCQTAQSWSVHAGKSSILLESRPALTPLLRDNDLLTSGELVLGATESLHNDSLVRVLATDRHDDLSDVDTGDSTVGLAPGTTHAGLQPIGSSARKHLVDTDNVEGVNADAQVERVLAGGLDDVLVGANTGGLEGLGRELLVLVGDKVAAEGLPRAE